MTDPLIVTASLDRARLQRGVAHTVHLVAELIAAPAVGDRAPLSLALAVDTSGSMEGEKLKHVIASIQLVLQQLRPSDSVSLVSFSNVARALPVKQVTSLRAEGGTNVEAGLRLAAELAKQSDGRPAVLLLSDGQPNAGAMTPRTLAAVARELNVPVSTLGYGSDHSVDVLSALAEAGRGTYAYVPRPELCRLELARAVSAQAEVVAEGVTICIEPRRGVTVEGPRELSVADFLAGDRAPVAFKLKLEPYLELGPASLARLVVKQKPLHVIEVDVTAEVADEAGPLDAAVHAKRLLCTAKEARAKATQLADASKFDEARAELERVIAEIRRAPASANGAELTEVLEQLIDDVALMHARPSVDALAAFKRGQTATAPRRADAKAFANVPRAKLIVLDGSSRTEVLIDRELTLGRTAQADVVLQSGGVSRQHTRIVPGDGSFWVNDLGSTNGTSLNGVRIASERLRDGDVIQVGDVRLLYRES